MYTLFITIEVIIGLLLIVVVLMQSSKGEGLAGTFGGTNLGAVFGVRRTSDFLSKLTQVLAGLFMILALVINLWFLPTSEKKESVIQSGPPPVALPPAQETPGNIPIGGK